MRRAAIILGAIALAILVLLLVLRLGGATIPLADLRARYAEPGGRYETVDGVQLYVRDEGQGPVLLLLHGHFQSSRIWDPWARQLTGRMRVIRFDMPPYGLSGPDPTGVYSPQRVQQLLDALIRQDDLHDITIGGISTGSAIATRYAAAHPERVRRLILVNAPLVPIPPRLQPKSPWLIGTLESWLFRPIYRPRLFYRYMLDRLFADPARVTPQLVGELYDMHRKPGNRAALEQFTASLRFADKSYAGRMGTMAQQLAAIHVPTLILWGGAGTMLPVSVAEDLVHALPNSPVTLRVYPGAGHFLPIEAPQAAPDIARFVAGR